MAPSLPTLCQEGKLKKVRAALVRGEDVNQSASGGFTGLMVAALKGHEAVVELLLQQPGLEVNLFDEEFRQTVLHLASTEGHTGIVRRLLAHPSLTCHNAVDSDGVSPLMEAVWNNRVKCVRELVAVEGVDLETRDSQGRSLEEVAREEGSQEAWQVVREELGRREEQKREERKREERRREDWRRTLSIEEIMAMVECAVCCEEMAPPRTIFQCSQGHPVCSSCRPRLRSCPTCRASFMGRAIGMEQLVQAVRDREGV